jgi:uncharacterized protein involved in type VI secretion and phage assembly
MMEQAIAIGAALSAFGADSQHNRLMRMDFHREDGPAAILLVDTLLAREGLSRCFRFDVALVSDDARIFLKSMMARMVTISLVRDDGLLRYFNGYVRQFRFVRIDGGFAFYRMILEPWLSMTRLHADCVSFQDKSALQITEETFSGTSSATGALSVPMSLRASAVPTSTTRPTLQTKGKSPFQPYPFENANSEFSAFKSAIGA